MRLLVGHTLYVGSRRTKVCFRSGSRQTVAEHKGEKVDVKAKGLRIGKLRCLAVNCPDFEQKVRH